MSLPDVQKQEDHRGIAINRVGVSGIRYPLHLPLKTGEMFHTVANIALSVSLSAEEKGTHMSRLVSILTHVGKHLHPSDMPKVLEQLLEKLEAEDAFVSLDFPIFLNKQAPVSGQVGLLDHDCRLESALSKGGQYSTLLQVKVNITSVCPCSKEISIHGAHNQRGQIVIQVQPTKDTFLWFEDLIDIAEQAGSQQVYPILKREDEKYVTEHAYENPKFVEDIVRDVALHLLPRIFEDQISWFSVSCTNQESIHNHNAWARIEEGERGPLLCGW